MQPKTTALIAELENLATETAGSGPDAARLTVAVLKAHEQALADLQERLRLVERAIRDTE